MLIDYMIPRYPWFATGAIWIAFHCTVGSIAIWRAWTTIATIAGQHLATQLWQDLSIVLGDFVAGISACFAKICFDTSTDTHIMGKYEHGCPFERTIAQKQLLIEKVRPNCEKVRLIYIYITVQFINPLLATKTHNCAVMCTVCDVIFPIKISLWSVVLRFAFPLHFCLLTIYGWIFPANETSIEFGDFPAMFDHTEWILWYSLLKSH